MYTVTVCTLSVCIYCLHVCLCMNSARGYVPFIVYILSRFVCLCVYTVCVCVVPDLLEISLQRKFDNLSDILQIHEKEN